MKFLILFFIISFNAFAFKYTPMSLTLENKNGQNAALVYLENDSNAPIAIQLTVTKRIMKIDGSEDQPEELNDIDVYPNQMIIQPFEKKSVKVSYKGSEFDGPEKAFRIIAEQLPIDLEKNNKKKKGNVKILLRYVGALYVDNGKTESKIELKSFTATEKILKLNLENTGTKHQVLGNLKLQFIKGKNKIELASNELKNFSGENILPKMEREFVLPKNEKLKIVDSSYEVKFKFDQD